jgi:Cu-Zn family superoxide dismutase
MKQIANNLLFASILASAPACSKPSDRYQGISEPREITAERSPATRPTITREPEAGVIGAAVPRGPAHDDTDSPGTMEPNLAPDVARGPGSVGREGAAAQRSGRTARARFQAAPDVQLNGSAELEEIAGGVRVTVSVETPRRGSHGTHVHEKGDCSDIPGESMGGHFAPDGRPHGLPGYRSHHLGDLGNLTVHKSGEGELEIEVPAATLEPGGPRSLLGRAIVIHAKRDEGARKQPAGASGPPIACAVIEPEP